AVALFTEATGIPVEVVLVRTEGDQLSTEGKAPPGGDVTGVFTRALDEALREGRCDFAIHSLKDLPTDTADDLVLAAVPLRADPRDALVGSTLGDLPPGAVVATGSARRRAQLAHLRPDLAFVGLRGNMASRLDRVDVGHVRAVVVAAAALDRLGLADRMAERLAVSDCLPQVGQGALALECRAADEPVRSLVAGLDDDDAHLAVAAERAFLRALGAGCTLPVAGHAVAVAAGTVRLEGLIASGDGRVVVRGMLDGDDPEVLGPALARLLVVERGASSIEGWEEARETVDGESVSR
ncbi:MAG: hydroxymethylbilane synthase, partial [Acidimicrobiales bacterium]